MPYDLPSRRYRLLYPLITGIHVLAGASVFVGTVAAIAVASGAEGGGARLGVFLLVLVGSVVVAAMVEAMALALSLLADMADAAQVTGEEAVRAARERQPRGELGR